MASRWSTEHLVTEHRDIQASAMAVNQSGQLALLAGKRALAVLQLNKPSDGIHKVARQSKYEINAVQWNPHASHSKNFVTASNQRADVWSWEESRAEISCSLKAHTRVISDVDWSPFTPDIVSTCSVDTFTFLWDIRDTRKPTLSLQGISGASQVKWNKTNSHLLATCHDGDIRVWDPRKGNTPIQYIAGHLSKIFGLDWSPDDENQLATSSQDCTVKFWDITNPRQCIDKLTTTGSPVWRARYTPFGEGLVTVVVPQLRRGENSLFLWNRSDLTEVVHTFVGHNDVVLEFQWRKPQEDNNYQLVTWSKDQTLRLWTVDALLQKMCGAVIEDLNETLSPLDHYEETNEEPTDLSIDVTNTEVAGEEKNADVTATGHSNSKVEATPPRTTPRFGRDENMYSPQQPKSLQQEFTLVNLENVTLDKSDVINRTCTLSTASSNGKCVVKLTMVFPEAYPNHAVPTFKLECSNIGEQKQTKLINTLNQTAKHFVKNNRSCIEPCLRQMNIKLNSIMDEDAGEDSTPESSYKHNQSGLFGPLARYHLPSQLNPYNFQDHNIPFPRTSGARFCANGMLVCFFRQKVEAVSNSRRMSSTTDVTPRAMSELSAYSVTSQVQGGRTPIVPTQYKIFGSNRSPPSDSNVSLRNYYTYIDRFAKNMHHSSREKAKPKRSRSRSRHNTELHGELGGSNLRSPKKTETKELQSKSKMGPVVLYDVASLLPINSYLAENYMLDTSDIGRMCAHNGTLAASVGRKDLLQLWSLLGMMTDPKLKPHQNPDDGDPWAQHPFGKKMLTSLLSYYIAMKDVQTLAMVACTLGSKFDPDKVTSADTYVKSSRSTTNHNAAIYNPSTANHYKPYHTIHPTDTDLKNLAKSVSKMKRSNSLSDMSGDYVFAPQQDPAQVERKQHQHSISLLDTGAVAQYDQYKNFYADILYEMGLLNQRAQVLKYVSTAPEPHKGIEFQSICYHCGDKSRGAQCWHNNCKLYAFRCEICHISVKGASTFCLACGHGGHTSHMGEWFKSHDVCPTGCGCLCLQNNPMTPESSLQSLSEQCSEA